MIEKSIDCMNLVEEIQEENVTLDIYYLDYNTMTIIPLKPDLLKSNYCNYVIHVKNRILKKHIGEIEKICKLKDNKAYIQNELDLRIHCEFIKKSKIIFTISLGGFDENVLVNGVQMQNDMIYFNFISKFLPQE